jgi:pimeloyl-ACP methyl ester carboxylesterase
VTDPSVERALATLAAPPTPEHLAVEAAGIPFHALAWGDASAPPVVALHGVASSAGTWWRVGPAIAAAGYRVIAPDLPGHGRTGHWVGHVAFRDSATDLVAFARAAVPAAEPGEVRIVGHSWGGMIAAALPSAGFAPLQIVLLDPPALPLAVLEEIVRDPSERRYDDLAEAVAAVGSQNPTWGHGDVLAKAEALTQVDEPAVRAVLTRNGDWDAGLAALADPAAREVPIRLIRGDPATGGMVPDAVVSAFVARLGAGNVATIAGGPHSPQRTHPVETTKALLAALA